MSFENFRLNDIYGYKFEDLNGINGDENHPRLLGWTIFIDANDNGDLDEGEVSTTTDENGEYWFTDLFLGTYNIREVVQDHWQQTFGDADITVDTSGDVWVAVTG